MKFLSKLAAAALMIILVSGCNSNDGMWLTNLDTAVQKAKAENKYVLVNFTGSDWCKWCIKLNDEVFSKEEFQKYADENLVLVKLDFPRNIEQSPEVKNYNDKLMRQFGVRGFPTIFILNSDGKAVAQTGYQPGGAAVYVDHLKGLIKS